jgi:hypothetical protein
MQIESAPSQTDGDHQLTFVNVHLLIRNSQ